MQKGFTAGCAAAVVLSLWGVPVVAQEVTTPPLVVDDGVIDPIDIPAVAIPQTIALRIVSQKGNTVRTLSAIPRGRSGVDKVPLPLGLRGNKLSASIDLSECVVDLKIEFADATIFERPNVDICHLDEIIFE